MIVQFRIMICQCVMFWKCHCSGVFLPSHQIWLQYEEERDV